MANREYSWKNTRYRSTFRLPNADHLGRWVTIAVVLAILVHIAMIVGLKCWVVSFPKFKEMLNIETEQVRVTEVEFREAMPDVPQEELAEPPKEAGELLEEIEALEELPEDTEVDIAPNIKEPEFNIKMEEPALKGEEMAVEVEPISGPDLAHELPEIGRTEDIVQDAAAGQIVIDPGELKAEEFDPDKFNEALERKGAGGLADKGALDGYTPLSEMTRMKGDALENAKGMIGSDLLFEFNKDVLRESARNSLLKVALLIDRNPGLNCWIEGHTDLIGGDESNDDLSLRRAKAVKNWLVESMRIEPERLIVVGYGKRQPIVTVGDQDAQAINRRVVIKMRSGRPEVGADGVVGDRGESPKPILVKPKRALPVEEETAAPAVPVEEPVAEPVEDPPARATPVEEDPAGRATIVEEEEVVEEPGTRAVPVDEESAPPAEPSRAVPVE